MTSDKLKEMIDKLKKTSSKEEKKEEPPQAEVPETVQETPELPAAVEPEVIETKKEVTVPVTVPVAVPVEPQPAPPENKQLTEEQTQRLISDRIVDLRDDGLFRIELLGQLGELRNSIELLNEVLVKLIG